MKARYAGIDVRANDWWRLPSGRMVCIRKVAGHGQHAEATVRYVDQDGAMAQGEFTLSVPFITRGEKVQHA